MKFGPKSLLLFACLCLSSVLAAAQGTTCPSDPEANAQGSPIACVTGGGVQVTSTSPVAPQAETLPLTPEQRPANPPVVSYVDGKLTVVAKNSTLGDVLRAIAAKTGASIDVPGTANERVVSQLGPAPARDVMASLLNGSHFNYVMVGTESNPNSVAHVILTAKTDRPEGSANTNASLARPTIQPRNALQAAIMQPYQEMLQQQQVQQAAAEELQQQTASESVPETSAQASSQAGVGTPAPTSSASSDSAPSEATAAAEAARAANASGEQTPQQTLQGLYETRRQMMQLQHQPPAPTPQQ